MCDRAEERAMRTFTLDELAEFNGRDGKPAYVAYDRLVYDVSDGPTWVNGDHLGHAAGEDLTDAMGEAPHGEEVFEGMPVVGKIEG
jgi:predicted heme/steroid binding protein